MFIYGRNLLTICFWMIGGVILWSCTNAWVKTKDRLWMRNIWIAMNFIGSLISIYIILLYTVLNRTPSNIHSFIFINEYGPEFHREMLMNALLYYPFGLTFASLIGPVAVIISFFMSVTIEFWQYYAGTGLAQGTDVIMNTLGCAVGSVSWILIETGVAGIIWEQTMSMLKRLYNRLKKASD